MGGLRLSGSFFGVLDRSSVARLLLSIGSI